MRNLANNSECIYIPTLVILRTMHWDTAMYKWKYLTIMGMLNGIMEYIIRFFNLIGYKFSFFLSTGFIQLCCGLEPFKPRQGSLPFLVSHLNNCIGNAIDIAEFVSFEGEYK